MIFAARIRKRASADIAQRMGNQLDIALAHGAKIFGVAAMNSPAAGPATGRIEPVHDPIKTICQRWMSRALHGDHGIYQIGNRGQ
jgi:hypothetical protein